MDKGEKFEYLEYKTGKEVQITKIPIKKEGIYYLSGEENYWLISAGKTKDLQNPFVEKSIIGIAWDKLNISDVKENEKEDLKDLLEKEYSELKKFYETIAGYRSYISGTATKLIRFVNEMNLGDIVVLKDRGNNKVYFGKVISEALDYEKDDLPVDPLVGNCNKVRKVRWLKKVEKDEIGSELKLAFTARHALSAMKNEKVIDEVNREMFSYFYRGENLHMVFRVGIEKDIPHDDFIEFQELIHNLKNECIAREKTENIFNIKTNVQSPGPIEFFGNPEIIKYVLAGLGIGSGIGMMKNYGIIKKKLKLKEPEKEDKEIKDGFSEGN